MLPELVLSLAVSAEQINQVCASSHQMEKASGLPAVLFQQTETALCGQRAFVTVWPDGLPDIGLAEQLQACQ